MESDGRKTRIAVIFYSATGNIHRLAEALSAGASDEGAEIRVRRVGELAPEQAIQANSRWAAYHSIVVADPIATLEDLEWADGIALGSPTRFGLPSAQLKQFLDQTGGLWARGAFHNKVGTSFTSASSGHGGLEASVLAMNTIFYHWGALIMPLGYSSDAAKVTGNPYGASWVSLKSASPDAEALASASWQGARLARFARAVRSVSTGV